MFYKLILLASNGNNIGKSTTAHILKDHLNSSCVMSFADPIRKQVELLYSTCIHNSSFMDLYTQEDKNTKLGDIFFKYDLAFAPSLVEMTPRLLVNRYSDMIQELISPQIWAHAAYLSILEKADTCNVFIFDDFRREIEYNYLKDTLKCFDIITVYLDKEGMKKQVSTAYEGQLENFNFTHRFTFTEDYSNVDELVRLLCP